MDYIVRESKQRVIEATGNEKEDIGWRRLTQSERDLPTTKQDRMIDVAHFLYQKNPMAKRIIRIMVDYILGGGVQFHAEEKDVQSVIDRHWNDPINCWDLKQDERITGLHLTGEMVMKTTVSEQTGLVRVASVDPKQIDQIFCSTQNTEQLEYITFKNDEKKYKIIGYDYNTGGISGEVFYFAINKVSGQVRGISDLFAEADWLDMHDKTMWTIAERVPLLYAFVYDISISGANDESLRAKYSNIIRNPPKPGSFNLHNEKETWQALTPDLKGRDVRDIMRPIKGQSLMASGFPLHWFLETEDQNTNTAQQVSEPVFRGIKNAQKYVKYIFKSIIDFQLLMAQSAGYLKSNNLNYEIKLQEPSQKDTSKTSAVIEQTSRALEQATINGWISKETARMVFTNLLNEFGFEIDPGREDTKIADEKNNDPDLDRIAQKVKELNGDVDNTGSATGV